MTYERTETVQAVQITFSTFDAPHPNPEHIIGVIYDPRTLSAVVRINEHGDVARASLGDWIVTDADGLRYVLSNDSFIAAGWKARAPGDAAP